MQRNSASHRRSLLLFLVLLLLPAFLLISGCCRKKNSPVSQLRELNRPQWRIGCMTGIVATRGAQQRLPNAEHKEYSMPIDAFTALCAGRIHAVILDRPTLEFMAMAHPELAVMQEDLAMGHISVAAAKQSRELMAQVNKFIRQYRKDGTYRAMYDRWFRTKDAEMPEIPTPAFWKKVLKVGVTANNEPLCFIKNGELAGFDSEFSLRLGAFLQRRVQFVDLPYDALVAALESGKIDLAVAYMDAMPEREESVLFSENYVDSPIACLIRKEYYKGSVKIARPEDLNHSRRVIACESEILCTRAAKKKLPNARFLEFTGPSDCYLALGMKKVDAVVYDRPALEYAALARPEFVVLPENIAVGHISVAAAKGEEKLIGEVNRFIRQYRKDGTCRAMYDRWVRTKTPVMPDISKPENPAGKLVVGITSYNPPMCFVADGKYSGFDVEFAYRLGAFLKKEIRLMDLTYEGLIPALNGKKIDLAIAQMDVTPERKESVAFSEEYIESPSALMIRKADYAGDVSGGADAAEETLSGKLLALTISLGQSFEKTFIREKRWKLILQGMRTTILITFFSVMLGTLLAFPVCMMCRSGKKWLSLLGERYVSLIMGTPILVILMILYYVVFAKVDISGAAVAVLAFAMDFAAYTSVMLRSGIDGIPRGQTEAALALGHKPHAAFFRFILPQAVRTVLPVYRGEIISTLKATSVVGYIAIMDLTKMGDIIRSRTYEAFFPLIAIAVLYFLTAKLLTSLLLILEDRLDPDTCRKRLLKKRGML